MSIQANRIGARHTRRPNSRPSPGPTAMPSIPQRWPRSGPTGVHSIIWHIMVWLVRHPLGVRAATPWLEAHRWRRSVLMGAGYSVPWARQPARSAPWTRAACSGMADSGSQSSASDRLVGTVLQPQPKPWGAMALKGLTQGCSSPGFSAPQSASASHHRTTGC